MPGSTSLGTGTLILSGVATYASTALGVGSDAVTAAYAGTLDFSASTSRPASMTVNAPPGATTTALSASSTRSTSRPATHGVQVDPTG
jgi:Bacterial Ig-like domain (group 3)